MIGASYSLADVPAALSYRIRRVLLRVLPSEGKGEHTNKRQNLQECRNIMYFANSTLITRNKCRTRRYFAHGKIIIIIKKTIRNRNVRPTMPNNASHLKNSQKNRNSQQTNRTLHSPCSCHGFRNLWMDVRIISYHTDSEARCCLFCRLLAAL